MAEVGDPGTFRWFGRSWGAPCNDVRAQIPVPVGQPCAAEDCLLADHTGCRCPGSDGYIRAEHSGVEIPRLALADGVPVFDVARWHLECWFRELGIDQLELRPENRPNYTEGDQ